jgi:Zn-finger nucleic acid-binding protein
LNLAPDCPLCRKPTVPEPRTDIVAHRCRECRGHWLGGITVKRHLARCEGLPDAEQLIANARAFPRPPRKLECPDCRTASFHTVRVKSVAIDICETCSGLYLDRREFERFKDFRTTRRTQPDKVVESTGDALGDGLIEGIFKLIVSLLD